MRSEFRHSPGGGASERHSGRCKARERGAQGQGFECFEKGAVHADSGFIPHNQPLPTGTAELWAEGTIRLTESAPLQVKM